MPCHSYPVYHKRADKVVSDRSKLDGFGLSVFTSQFRIPRIIFMMCGVLLICRYASSSDHLSTDDLLLFLEAEQGVCTLVIIAYCVCMLLLTPLLCNRLIGSDSSLRQCALSYPTAELSSLSLSIFACSINLLCCWARLQLIHCSVS